MLRLSLHLLFNAIFNGTLPHLRQEIQTLAGYRTP
jgi:hypothetical protein